MGDKGKKAKEKKAGHAAQKKASKQQKKTAK